MGLKSFIFPGRRKQTAEKVAGAGRSHGIQDRSEIGEGRLRKISFLRLPQNLKFLFMTLLTEMPRKCSVNHGCNIGLKKFEGPLEKSNLVIDFKLCGHDAIKLLRFHCDFMLLLCARRPGLPQIAS